MSIVGDPFAPSGGNVPAPTGQLKGDGVPQGSVTGTLPDGSFGYQAPDGSLYYFDGTPFTGTGGIRQSTVVTTGTVGSGGSGGVSYVITTQAGQKLTQQQYDALAVGLRQTANQYGQTLSDSLVHELIKGDVSPSLLTERLDAVQYMNDNQDALDQFGLELKKYGLTKGWDPKHKLDFVTGLAPKNFYKLWEEAQTRTSAIKAGLTITQSHSYAAKDKQTYRTQQDRDLQISANQVIGVARDMPGRQTEADTAQFWQQYAQLALTLLPDSRYRGLAINKNDLIAYAEGDQSKGAEVEQALRNLQAATQTKVATGSAKGLQGLGSSSGL